MEKSNAINRPTRYSLRAGAAGWRQRVFNLDPAVVSARRPGPAFAMNLDGNPIRRNAFRDKPGLNDFGTASRQLHVVDGITFFTGIAMHHEARVRADGQIAV